MAITRAWLDTLERDLHYACRSMARSPGFALVAVLTLGAGIALCLTVLTIVNAYLIRPLPYPDAGRLYTVDFAAPGQSTPRGLSSLDWSVLDDVVEHFIAWDLDMFYVLGGPFPEPTPGAWVTPGFPAGLGLRLARGRHFEAPDFLEGGPVPVLISHRLWVTRFGSDPGVVGRSLRAYVSDRPDEPEALTIVGIVASDFWHVNSYTDVLAPLRAPAYPYQIRLREGVDPRAAEARLTALVRSAGITVPDGWRAGLASVQARYVEEMRPLLSAVAASAGLVLLIGCANVAALLLVRSTRRRHEVAVRLALGVSLARLTRLLGFEGLLLGGLATVAGLGGGLLLTRALASTLEQHLGRRLPGGEAALSMDVTLLAAAVAGGLILSVVLTAAPLLALWSTPVTAALKSGGRHTTDGRVTHRVRSALIAAEVAAALALLAGSALMIETMLRMVNADLGFEPAGVVSTSVGLRPRAYPDTAGRARFFERLLIQLRERDPDGAAALGDGWVLQSARPRRVETAAEHPVGADAAVVRVSASYFAALGIAFRAGGTFAAQDRPGGEPVAVVSESLGRRLWPGEQPIGQRLRIPDPAAQDTGADSGTAHVVVGVVADVRQLDTADGRVRNDAHQLEAYLPLLQDAGRFAFLYSRSGAREADGLQAFIARLDPQAAVATPRALAAALDTALARPRGLAWLLSAFATFASLLAILGVYSVIAYSVRQREREIAVRLVVGADPRDIRRLFVREGGRLVAAGLVAGVLGALILGRVLQSQLFGVGPAEPRTLAATTVVLALCGWVAFWLPARRAAAVDPARMLSDE